MIVRLVLLVLVIKHEYDKRHVYLDKLWRSATANSIPVARRIMLVMLKEILYIQVLFYMFIRHVLYGRRKITSN